MEAEPGKSSSGAGRILDLLLQYFFVPTREGFSAYRTGWLVHFVYSIVLATAITAGVVALGFTILHGLSVATLGVSLLWGTGIIVGVYSHYSPLILLAALAVIGGLIFYHPAAPYLALSFLVALAVHVVIVPVLIFGLRQVRKLFP
jgi:hypothetical protein